MNNCYCMMVSRHLFSFNRGCSLHFVSLEKKKEGFLSFVSSVSFFYSSNVSHSLREIDRAVDI
jgi:hypothetical protein